MFGLVQIIVLSLTLRSQLRKIYLKYEQKILRIYIFKMVSDQYEASFMRMRKKLTL